MKDRALFLRQLNAEETTKRSYSYMLAYLENARPLHNFTPESFLGFVRARGWANPTARLALAALKAYLRWLGAPHPMLDLRIPKRQSQPGRRLTLEQRDNLLQAAERTYNPERDQAIIRVLWDTFVRSFELTEARLDGVNLKQRELVVLTKAANGKGRQWELKRFSPETAAALQAWLDKHPGGERLFPLTRDGLACLFKRLGRHVGLRVSPHDFRRGGASYQVERGVPDRLVMKQGGWRSHEVFERYTIGAELRALDELLWNAQ